MPKDIFSEYMDSLNFSGVESEEENNSVNSKDEYYDVESMEENKSSPRNALNGIYGMLTKMSTEIETEIEKILESKSASRKITHTDAGELIKISELINKLQKKDATK